MHDNDVAPLLHNHDVTNVTLYCSDLICDVCIYVTYSRQGLSLDCGRYTVKRFYLWPLTTT